MKYLKRKRDFSTIWKLNTDLTPSMELKMWASGSRILRGVKEGPAIFSGFHFDDWPLNKSRPRCA